MINWNKKKASELPPYDFDYPVMKLTEKDYWTVRDAVEGIQGFGKPGAGKTSGFGRMLARAMLEAGYGGLVQCVKSGEAKTWLKYADETGQLSRIRVFSSPERLAAYQDLYPQLEVSVDDFNPFTYENERPKAKGGGTVQGIVDMILMAVDMADRLGSTASGVKPDFWQKNMKLLLTYTIGLLKLAGEKGGQDDFSLTVRNINRFINGAPKGQEEVAPDSYIGRVFEAAQGRVDDLEKEYAQNKSVETIKNYNPFQDAFESAEDVLEDARSYFESQYFPMPEKQRSGIESTWNGFAGYFTGDGILAKRFSGGISDNLRPSVTMDGEQPKIIILDFPLKLFGVNGLLGQSLFKTIWQNSLEGRTEDDLETVLPSFLWCDESQFFLTERDQEFLTTAREAKCITCLITQNKGNYDHKLGAQLSNTLLGLLGSVVFHWQDHAETNAFAVKRMGQEKRMDHSHTRSADGGMSISSREVLANHIEAYEFLDLKPDLKNLYTYAYFFQAGRIWSNDKRYLKVTFDMMYGKRELKKPIIQSSKIKDLWLIFNRAWERLTTA